MAAQRPNGSIDIWNFVDNVTGTTVRKWLRDSWARRKIVALQQAVSSIVVPTRTSQLTNDSGYITQADVPPGSTASTTTPKMDGTAAVGTENAFARGDHRHPSDTNKADKATTLAGYGITNAYTKTEVDGMIPTVPTNVSAFTNDAGYINSGKFAEVSGVLASAAGNSTASAFPEGFTVANTFILSLMVKYNGNWWQVGDGVLAGNGRLYAQIVSAGVRVYNNSSFGYDLEWRAVLMRTDI